MVRNISLGKKVWWAFPTTVFKLQKSFERQHCHLGTFIPHNLKYLQIHWKHCSSNLKITILFTEEDTWVVLSAVFGSTYFEWGVARDLILKIEIKAQDEIVTPPRDCGSGFLRLPLTKHDVVNLSEGWFISFESEREPTSFLLPRKDAEKNSQRKQVG